MEDHMEKEFDNTLTVKIENGGMITIQVLDIIDENPFNKSFIIYNVAAFLGVYIT